MPTRDPKKTPDRTAFGVRRHHSSDRLVSEAELESLLVWWRTTAKDRYGNPLFCIHHEHVGSCRQCPPPLGGGRE